LDWGNQKGKGIKDSSADGFAARTFLGKWNKSRQTYVPKSDGTIFVCLFKKKICQRCYATVKFESTEYRLYSSASGIYGSMACWLVRLSRGKWGGEVTGRGGGLVGGSELIDR
jgi:hypothetical protein